MKTIRTLLASLLGKKEAQAPAAVPSRRPFVALAAAPAPASDEDDGHRRYR